MSPMIGRVGFILAVVAAASGCTPKPKPTAIDAPMTIQSPSGDDYQSVGNQPAGRTRHSASSASVSPETPRRPKAADHVAHNKPANALPATQPDLRSETGERTSVRPLPVEGTTVPAAKADSSSVANSAIGDAISEIQSPTVRSDRQNPSRAGVDVNFPISTAVKSEDAQPSPSVDLPTLKPSSIDRPAGTFLNLSDVPPTSAKAGGLTLPLSVGGSDRNSNVRSTSPRIDWSADRSEEASKRALPGPGQLPMGGSTQIQPAAAVNLNVFDRLLANTPANASTNQAASVSASNSRAEHSADPDSAGKISLPAVSAGQRAPTSNSESLPLAEPNTEMIRQQLADERQDTAKRDQAARDAFNRGVLNALIGPAPTTAPSAPTTRPTLALPWK